MADPDGNDIGLMSPVDESRRTWPPEPSPIPENRPASPAAQPICVPLTATADPQALPRRTSRSGAASPDVSETSLPRRTNWAFRRSPVSVSLVFSLRRVTGSGTGSGRSQAAWSPVLAPLCLEEALAQVVWEADDGDGDAVVLERAGCPGPRTGCVHETGLVITAGPGRPRQVR